jgi:hypothetical protein
MKLAEQLVREALQVSPQSAYRTAWAGCSSANRATEAQCWSAPGVTPDGEIAAHLPSPVEDWRRGQALYLAVALNHPDSRDCAGWRSSPLTTVVCAGRHAVAASQKLRRLPRRRWSAMACLPP